MRSIERDWIIKNVQSGERRESEVDRFTGTVCDETRPFDFSKERHARDADASRVPSPLESVENYPSLPPITRRITINAVCRCNFQFCPAFLFPSLLDPRASSSSIAVGFCTRFPRDFLPRRLRGPGESKRRKEKKLTTYSRAERETSEIDVFRGVITRFPRIVFYDREKKKFIFVL